MAKTPESAVLIASEKTDEEYQKIHIHQSEFDIGRNKSASYIIRSVCISKTQCVFKKTDEKWTICDKSSFGTYLNQERLEKDKPTAIKDGDVISFGTTNFIYTFYTKDIVSKSDCKRIKLNDDVNSEQQQQQQELLGEKQAAVSNLKKCIADIKNKHETEKEELQKRLHSGNVEQAKVLQEKEELEKKHAEENRLAHEALVQEMNEKKLLEKKLKEMQHLLEEKERAQELLNKKLQEKEEERLRDLKQLQEQKDAQTKVMLEELKKKVEEKEELVKIRLSKEIQCLQEEKLKLETDIKGELSKKEGESAEKLRRLQDELEKVKHDLVNVEGKKQYLEKELEETTKAKEIASESSLKAKEDMLQNFGELMETELQCSICSELFVTATTLNCTHTFCKFCILEWKKKKKECPICRTAITSESRSLVLDNFIDKMVDSLSAELKNRRQEIVEARQIQELLGPKPKPETSEGSQRRRGRQRNYVPDDSSVSSSTNVDDVISISSTSSSSDIPSSDAESSDSDMSIEGIPGEYYGGYGYCYNCGRRGHWVRGCPYR